MSTLALCIPARNAADVLPRLVASVEAQTAPFDEMLVYDDASTDGTGDVARSLGARVVAGAVNEGPSAGKNRLAQATSCDWVHFHDADDALAPRFVEQARGWMDRPEVDVVVFATEDRDHMTGALLGQVAFDDGALRADPVAFTIRHTVTNAGIYRRGAFLAAGGFDTDERTRYNEDQAMHIRLALAGLRFRADSYPGVIIYRRPGSMSSGNLVACARAQVEVLKQAADATGTRYRDEIGRRAWRLAGVAATYQDWRYAREALGLAGRLGHRDPVGEDLAFRALARVSPFMAVRLREAWVRAVKPGLRRGLPRAS